jgi:hypothetical protein
MKRPAEECRVTTLITGLRDDYPNDTDQIHAGVWFIFAGNLHLCIEAYDGTKTRCVHFPHMPDTNAAHPEQIDVYGYHRVEIVDVECMVRYRAKE